MSAHTDNVTKTLSYLLVVIFLPLVGVYIYFSFGINYRKNKLYTKKIILDKEQRKILLNKLQSYGIENQKHLLAGRNYSHLAKMLFQTDQSSLTCNNAALLLINGEETFPEIIKEVKKAQHHIHIEYYIYEDDHIGNEIDQVFEKDICEAEMVDVNRWLKRPKRKQLLEKPFDSLRRCSN